MNDHLNALKIRQIVEIQMKPFIKILQDEISKVVKLSNAVKEKADDLNRFQQDKIRFDSHLRQIKQDLVNIQVNLASIVQIVSYQKGQSELSFIKSDSSINLMKEEIMSIQKKMVKKGEEIKNHDSRFNSIMDSLQKNQGYIDDRLTIYQDKFKKLTKQTLEMTKDIKGQFDKTVNNNICLKNQLVNKLKVSEAKEKVLDLYINERQDISSKLQNIHENLASFTKINLFSSLQKDYQTFQFEATTKIQQITKKSISNETKLKNMTLQLSSLDDLKTSPNQIIFLKEQILKLNEKMTNLQQKQQSNHETINRIRRQTQEDIQQKMIEVIDKKMQTIEDNIQQIQEIQVESFDQKINLIKQQFLKKISEYQERNQKVFQELRAFSGNQGQGQGKDPHEGYYISEQYALAKKERQLIEIKSKEIRHLAEGLHQKLIIFSNRITVCKSDVQRHIQHSSKQLKKMHEYKKQQESHMETIGKFLSQIMESILILVSLTLSNEKREETKTFVTFNDGIILQFQKEMTQSFINYRKFQLKDKDLKESLMQCLIKVVDDMIINCPTLKWSQHRPSCFFKKIISHLQSLSKKPQKSPSLIHSPKKVIKINEDDEDNLFSMNIQSQQMFKKTINKQPTITINNSNVMWNFQKPKSQIQKRYKFKKTQEKQQRQSQQRNFTTSRSHRKTKIHYL